MDRGSSSWVLTWRNRVNGVMSRHDKSSHQDQGLGQSLGNNWDLEAISRDPVLGRLLAWKERTARDAICAAEEKLMYPG